MVAPCPPLETVGLADLFLGRPRSRRYPKFNIRRDIPCLPESGSKIATDDDRGNPHVVRNRRWSEEVRNPYKSYEIGF